MKKKWQTTKYGVLEWLVWAVRGVNRIGRGVLTYNRPDKNGYQSLLNSSTWSKKIFTNSSLCGFRR